MRRFALVTLICLATAPLYAQDKATIQKLNEAFSEAFNKGDFAALADLYTQDATLMPPQADFVRGRDDIQKFWQAASDHVGDLRLTTLDVEPFGSDTAREIGTFTLKPKGQQEEVAGKYVVIWQRVGGDWKLATDIWNTNK
ncbi:YybH family protein [Microvirga roseola]|uniref:YybH family protein n=1 Tax=Microvirga roseola TaxID=2883126 RepID=UPI001E5C1BF0|nr:SgcJ/EcaC family oxidoreductase [Microvirga roseola]